MTKQEKQQVIDIIAQNIYVEAAKPKENSEYHIGFNICQTLYAEAKLKAIKVIENL